MASLWLRLYTEIIYDSKLRRLPPSRRWLWITLLCIAKVSPRPGWLLLSEGVPVTVKDIADKAAVTVNVVKAGLSDFTYLRMVERLMGWWLLNWDKRQLSVILLCGCKSTGKREKWQRRLIWLLLPEDCPTGTHPQIHLQKRNRRCKRQ